MFTTNSTKIIDQIRHIKSITEEHDRLVANIDTANQIINEQSRDLRKLRAQNFIDDFRHTQMADVLRSFTPCTEKMNISKKIHYLGSMLI